MRMLWTIWQSMGNILETLASYKSVRITLEKITVNETLGEIKCIWGLQLTGSRREYATNKSIYFTYDIQKIAQTVLTVNKSNLGDLCCKQEYSLQFSFKGEY